MAKSDIEMVQEYLRNSKENGFDITTPRFVDVLGKPYHATQRNLNIYEGYTAKPHGSAAAILPSENVSKVLLHKSVFGALGPHNKHILAEHYVPRTILLDKDEKNPYGPEASHHWVRRDEHGLDYTHLDPDNVYDLSHLSSAMATDESGALYRRDEHHINTIHDFIRSAHSTPTVGFVTPDFIHSGEPRRFMEPKDFAHFNAAMRAFPPTDIEDMVSSGPMGAFPDNSFVAHSEYLGTQLPHGMIHVRKFQRNNNGQTVHHYQYDPSEESLKHLVTKEFDRENG